MKVSINSWHYRLLEYYKFEQPHNLCPYFWKVVASVVFTPIILIGLAIGALMVAYEKRHEPRPSKNKISDKVWTRIFFLGFLFGLGTYMLYTGSVWWWAYAGFFVYIGFTLFFEVFMKKHPFIMSFERKERKPKKPKEPNLAIEYLKAKKHKYCPYITFTDDKINEEQWRRGLE